MSKLSLSSFAWHATFGTTTLVYAGVALSSLNGDSANIMGISIYAAIMVAFAASSMYLVRQLLHQRLTLGSRNDWVLLQIGVLTPLNNVIANTLRHG